MTTSAATLAAGQLDRLTIRTAHGLDVRCWTEDDGRVIVRVSRRVGQVEREVARLTLTPAEAAEVGMRLLACSARGESPCIW